MKKIIFLLLFLVVFSLNSEAAYQIFYADSTGAFQTGATLLLFAANADTATASPYTLTEDGSKLVYYNNSVPTGTYDLYVYSNPTYTLIAEDDWFVVTSDVTTAKDHVDSVFNDGVHGFGSSNIDFGSYQIRSETVVIDIATGTAPLELSSSTKCDSLNSDFLDGQNASEFLELDGTDAMTGSLDMGDNDITNINKIDEPDTLISKGYNDLRNVTKLDLMNDVDLGSYKLKAETFESDVSTGTAPFTVASTTTVTNLNADKVDGLDSNGLVIKSAPSLGADLDCNDNDITECNKIDPDTLEVDEYVNSDLVLTDKDITGVDSLYAAKININGTDFVPANWIKADGTVPLTATWLVSNENIEAVNKLDTDSLVVTEDSNFADTDLRAVNTANIDTLKVAYIGQSIDFNDYEITDIEKLSSTGAGVDTDSLEVGKYGNFAANAFAIGDTVITVNATELNQLDGVVVGGNTAGDIVTIDDTQTITGVKTFSFATLNTPNLNNALLNTKVQGTAFKDDDTFATASDSTVASSESIKEYVDAQVSGQWRYIRFIPTDMRTGHASLDSTPVEMTDATTPALEWDGEQCGIGAKFRETDTDSSASFYVQFSIPADVDTIYTGLTGYYGESNDGQSNISFRLYRQEIDADTGLSSEIKAIDYYRISGISKKMDRDEVKATDSNFKAGYWHRLWVYQDSQSGTNSDLYINEFYVKYK
jgi:hypothetical protein